MKYINETSNRGIVNLFADFLVKEINKINNYDVVIEVTDCGKFFVVNGMTNSDKILDMVILKETFLETNKLLLKDFGYENVNIIDLIVYNLSILHIKFHCISFCMGNTFRFPFEDYGGKF